jgi:CSLREA domain-containing protein
MRNRTTLIAIVLVVALAVLLVANSAVADWTVADGNNPGTSADCQELLTNGDFETGSLLPWQTWGEVGLGSGHNSAYGAWLGGTDNAEGEMWQGVTIPVGANPVELEFWWRAESTEEQPGDAVDVIVQYDEQADLLHSLPAVDPVGQWRHDVADLTAYAGQMVFVTFLVHTDDQVPSTFLLDDVSLTACGATTPTPTPTGTIPPSPSQHVYLPVIQKSPIQVTPTPTPTPTQQPSLIVNTTDDTVDGTCDSTHCSLLEAVNAANINSGPDTITFNIPSSDQGCDGAGVCTIRPTSFSVYLSDDGTTIDGYSQSGASPNINPVGQPINAVLKIVLDGSLLPECCPAGLDIRSSNNVVRGLVIQRFYTGIDVVDADGNRFEGNFIGTDVHGTTALGNRCSGILLSGVQGGAGSSNNVVGGSTPQARNLISGNGCSGVEVGPTGSNQVQGNYIGSNANGTGALPNNGSGVRVYNVSQHNLIGGSATGEPNLVAFNGQNGVTIDGGFGNAVYNTITRNRIHSNTGKGIALTSNGNEGLAAPVITTASASQVSGTACASCTVEVFSDAADEGAIYEGTTIANASGNWTLTKAGGLTGPYVTATATDANGNTSEFSGAVSVP